jgi:hypothetical protein
MGDRPRRTNFEVAHFSSLSFKPALTIGGLYARRVAHTECCTLHYPVLPGNPAGIKLAARENQDNFAPNSATSTRANSGVGN